MRRTNKATRRWLTLHAWDDHGKKIKQMLIEAGANEDYQRRGAIFITQKGTGSIGHKVFSKGTNSVNRYTLFELIASAYGGQPGRHLGISATLWHGVLQP